MIPNRTALTGIVFFFFAGAFMGFSSGPKEAPPVIHVSKRVKIERPAEKTAHRPEKAAEEKTAAEKAAVKDQAYKVKGTRFRMGGKIYAEGATIKLTAAQAKRYRKYLA